MFSDYRHRLAGANYRGELDPFIDDFLKGRVNRFGFWGTHVQQWLDCPPAKEGRLLPVRFEDLRRDPASVLGHILTHLGQPFRSASIEAAIANNSIDAMRAKEDAEGLSSGKLQHRFVNTGGAQSGQDKLSPDQIAKIEKATGTLLDRLGYAIAR